MQVLAAFVMHCRTFENSMYVLIKIKLLIHVVRIDIIVIIQFVTPQDP